MKYGPIIEQYYLHSSTSIYDHLVLTRAILAYINLLLRVIMIYRKYNLGLNLNR